MASHSYSSLHSEVIVRDRMPMSRRLLLQSGGVAAAGIMCGIEGAAGVEAKIRQTRQRSGGPSNEEPNTEYFKGMYATEADPWRFVTSPYERDKYAATLAALPRPHDTSAPTRSRS